MAFVVFLLCASLITAGQTCPFDWPPVPSSVPNPPSHRHNSNDEDLLFRQFSLDIIKEKMLRSLGMVKAPRLSAVASSTLPPRSSNLLKNDLKRLPLAQHRVPRDPSANLRSSRVIVFAQLGSVGGACHVPSDVTASPALSTLTFKLPNSPALIRNAVLWYKTAHGPNGTTSGQAWLCPCTTATTAMPTANESLSMADNCTKWAPSTAADVSSATISRRPPLKHQMGWSSVRFNEFGPRVEPVLQTGSGRRILIVIGDRMRTSERKRPFLVLEVGNETPKRTERSTADLPVDCSADRSSPCCRTGFWVDVRQLGWSDWIISPAGFYYHYCKGHCPQGFNSMSNRESQPAAGPLDYSQVMNAYVRRFNLNLRPCCVPRKMAHLPVVITTDGASINRTFVPNFIVNECACLGVA